MGLLYLLPVSTDEGDRVEASDEAGLTLKSYGLPMLFWGYLAGAFFIISLMFIGIKDPMISLYKTQDPINQMLALICGATLVIIPSALLGFFFFEKRVLKKKNTLKLHYYLFWIKFWGRTFELKDSRSFTIEHFMDSPNMAKITNDPELRGFQNKGHFELYATTNKEKKILVDRSSRKADLVKLQEILSNF